LLKRSKEPSNFVRRRGPKSLSMLFGDAKRASKKKIKESQHIISRGHKNLNEEDQRISKC
jgi:glycerate kinase